MKTSLLRNYSRLELSVRVKDNSADFVKVSVSSIFVNSIVASTIFISSLLQSYNGGISIRNTKSLELPEIKLFSTTSYSSMKRSNKIRKLKIN